MNQSRHRIIFNAERGQRMVVSEAATAQGKSAGGENGVARAGRVERLGGGWSATSAITAATALLVVIALTALGPASARAQIVADPSAPGNQRPTVLVAPNGAPVVNIQTPSAAGVSRNTYSQFDVQGNGAVLNNSRTNVQTQLGGWVQGNPWLATGSARIIVNEVNSANPSQLRGYIEVAGQRAEVVIANPAGINVNGAGFINASRATLTTGTPLLQGGNLEGYRVQRGTIRIDGAGLDATLTDHTGILARAIEVNAGLWAQQLQLVTGDNTVSAAQDAVHANPAGAGASGSAPAFALDVSRLGGMYAGKIHLVGTEAGLGVRNAGLIDARGALTLSANGWLSQSTGARTYGDQVSIEGQGVRNENGAVIAARQSLAIDAGQIHNTEGALLLSAGDMRLQARERIENRSADIEALGNLSIQTLLLINANDHLQTELVQVQGPIALSLIQPAGTSTRIPVSSLVWADWERAGQYLYNTSPDPFAGVPVQLGTTPIPGLGQESCSDPNDDSSCVRLPGADYPRTDPAWAYFGLAVPEPEPPRPLGPVPQAPTPPAALPPGATPEQQAAHQQALADHQLALQSHQAALTTQATWQAWDTQTEVRYAALDSRIDTYNQGFAGAVIREWTRFDIQRSVSQTQVLRSQPGRISAAGDLTLTGQDLRNEDSQIVAAGALLGDLQQLVNQATPGEHVVQDNGSAQSSSVYSQRGGFFRTGTKRWYRNTTAPTPYAPPAERTAIDLGISRTAGSAGASTPPLLAQPSSALFAPVADPSATYLVETDPRFANYRQWLSSDYMLQALSIDPATTQKRLGDGFYEQKLIREQIAALTGYRFLADHTSDEQQYQALMTAGATFAQSHQLRPGVALSAEQVALLTSDIVWLVEQSVTLADGSTTKALVPQVYAVPRLGDLNGSGALMAARDVNINLSGDLSNAGTLAGRRITQINAQNIKNLGGTIGGTAQGSITSLSAQQDIANTGGVLQASDALLLQAGRDVNLATTTQSNTTQAGPNTFSRTTVDRVAALYVSNPSGALQVVAGQDITAQGAAIASAGSLALQAGQNINLATVTTEARDQAHWNATNYQRQSSSAEVGTSINAGGAIQISADQDVNLRAAQVNAGGALTVGAGGNVTIEAGQSAESLAEARQVKSKGFLSSKTTTTRTSNQSTTAQASELGGQSVVIRSGADTRISGSNVIADQDLNIQAGRNLSIEAAQNTQSASGFQETKKSGLFSSGGLSVTIGKQQQSTDQQTTQTTAAASTVGSVGGNVTLSAGQTYTQTGSDVLAPAGNIDINAQTVNITEARETASQSSEQRFKQSGLTLAITSPVLSALQTINSQIEAAGNTSSSMQALAGANVAMNARQAASAIQTGQGDANGMIKGADGKLVEANAADQAGGIGISISLGASSSQSQQSSSADNARGSNVSAGGNVNITASGAGQSSNLTIQGSRIEAGQTTTLKAEGDINLLAAANTTTESNSSKSSSGSIGVGFQLGAGGAGVGVTASAAKATGQGAGNSTSYTNTQVSGQTVNITSGQDTTLQGAVVSGEQVTAKVGGDLSIESLQDTSRYQESSKSAGGSVTFGAGAGASLNLSKTKIESDYESVGEQSGIRAGDGGFQVEVQGNTDLVGGAITSSEAAVQENRNRFESAGGLATSDIENSAAYSASGYSVGVGFGGGKPTGSAGIGSDKGSASSTTTAGISGIAGNAAARTGDQETGIGQVFDQDRVKDEVNAQVAITAEFGKQASKAVGDYAEKRIKEAQALRTQAAQQSDPQRRAELEQEAGQLESDWGDQGTKRLLAHTLVGGLTGGAAGAAGAAAGTLSAPAVAQALEQGGIEGPLATALTALASTAVGAGVGGTAGAAAAGNEVVNNFLSHEESSRRLRLQGEQLACKTDVCRQEKQVEIYRLNRLDAWRDQQIEQACKSPASAACQSWSAAISVAAASYEGQRGNLVDLAERSSVQNQAFKYQQAVNNPFMHGVGAGLLKLTPPGLAVGAVGGIAGTVQSITDNGLAQTLIDGVSAIANLPTELRSRLNSADPTVRGEALVDVITLGSGVSVIGAGGVRLTLAAAQAAQVSRAVAKAEEGAVARARVDNNASADMPGLGTSAVRDFKPGTTHRAENINAGQVTDRDGLQRIDDEKKINDAQLAQSLGLDKAPYYGTQRPAWMEGTPVQDKVLANPETYRMVVNEGEFLAIERAIQNGDSVKAAQNLGGWATRDPVTSTADVRGNLAISSEWKGQGGQDMYVIEFTAKPGVGVREGTVGPMFDTKAESTLPGGGHQVQFMDKSPRTNPELYQINLSNSRKLK